MRALVLAPFSTAALNDLAALMPVDHESWTTTRTLQDPEELGRRLDREGTTHLIIEADFAFEELFTAAPGLRFLGVCRSGLGHVDLDAATAAGVTVVNSPGRNAQAVAELVIGQMIALARQTPQLNRYVKSGRWEDPVDGYINRRGVELRGATLGIIGLGRVGRAAAEMASAMGMRVLAHDPYAGAPGDRISGAELVSLERLLQESRFVSLHAPPAPEVAGMLGARELALLPRGAYLVNTAFHDMVDEAALLDALWTGQLAGAALDVHDTHPVSPASPLLKLPNALMTPHVGGATKETVTRHSRMILDDIRRHLAGQRPVNLANPAVWEKIGA